jgi:hypothetical protein
MRFVLGCLVVAAVLGVPAVASASVLISAPAPYLKRCGARIEVGVWRRDDGQRNPRMVLITIRARSGRLLWHRRVHPTSNWRLWHYRPACGHRYVVRYKWSLWSLTYRIRVRS